GRPCWHSATISTSGGRSPSSATTLTWCAIATAPERLEDPTLQPTLRSLSWRSEVERRHVGLRNVDLDLGRIDVGAAIDPIGHRSRPKDDDEHQDHLQEHPGDGAPIDLRRLDRRRRD